MKGLNKMNITFFFFTLDIGKNYPGLSEKVKQKVTNIINSATSKYDLLAQITKDLLQSTLTKAEELKKILHDLFLQMKSNMQ